MNKSYRPEFLCQRGLVWPQGFARIPEEDRRDGRFEVGGARINVPGAQRRLIDTLSLFTRSGQPWRTTEIVVTANLEVGKSGDFLVPKQEPDDPGVCLYFRLDDQAIALPSDGFGRVADNMAAIAAHLEATRGIERWRVGTAAHMFAGYAALPPPAPQRDWWEVLGVAENTPQEVAEAAYRTLALKAHPDNGGSHDAMAELNAAIEAARSRS